MSYKTKKGDPVLIVWLARGESKVESARAANISESTVRRRLKDPDFRKEVSSYRRIMLDRAAGLLAAASSKAAQALEALIDDKQGSIPAHVIRSACRDVLDHAMKLREAIEYEERLQIIEEKLEKLNHAKSQF